MVPPENPPAGKNSGRHRAPDGDAQTAFIPRITDASPHGVPGGPLAPPVGLGGPATRPPGAPRASAVPGPVAPAPVVPAPVVPGPAASGPGASGPGASGPGVPGAVAHGPVV